MNRALFCLAAVFLLLPPALARAQDEEAAATGNPRVKMETSLGDIILELDAEKAPITVHNFLRYAQEKYYDGTIFHRVMSKFMIQGGGFTPEMDKKTEGLLPPIRNEWTNGLKNERGTISMARLGRQPDSATAQFFINVVSNPTLDQPRDGAGYAVFGKVVEGAEVVDKIRDTEVVTHPKYPGGPVVPKETVLIKSVQILDDYKLETAAALAEAVEEKHQKELQAAEAAEAEEKQGFLKMLEEVQVKATATESGLKYYDITMGEGASPEPTGTVTLHCTGRLADGTKFYSSHDGLGKPLTKRATGFVPGFNEGIATMKVGGKRILIIPGDLGYGPNGNPRAKIPPNATLVFEVELLAIK